MSTDTIPTDVDDIKAVTEAFLAGRAVDPVVARRVQERAAKVRQDMFEQFGLQDIGVPIIRVVFGARPLMQASGSSVEAVVHSFRTRRCCCEMISEEGCTTF